MRYPDAAAFRQALEQRLKSDVHGGGARLARDRKRVVFERLLARLLGVAPGQWLLKGGFALDLRLVDRARTTKDVDIDWQADEADLRETLIAATEHDAGDFFVFAIERTGTPEDHLGGSHRFRVSVSLAGRRFETFVLDVGFRPTDWIAGDTLSTENLLAFAGVAAIQVQAIPLELHVAEKLHAYTRTYEGRRANTRVKDLIDLTLIAELSPLDAARLRTAIASTFADRASHPVPVRLPSAPPEWAPQFRRLAQTVGVPLDVAIGHRESAALLDPVLSGETTSGDWNPEHRRWTPDHMARATPG